MPVGNIVITGATGFLGTHVHREFVKRGYPTIGLAHRKARYLYNHKPLDNSIQVSTYPEISKFAYRAYDLMEERDINSIYRGLRPIGLINLAAVVGGIGANQENPGRFIYENLKMGMQLIHRALKSATMRGEGKFVQLGTVCSYPKHTPVPFKEEYLWNGYPEETNAPYGIAKKTLMEMIKAYNQQYPEEFRGICLIPVNLYGPMDNFNPKSSHVIPALIRKIYIAYLGGEATVELWGTGEASREFLYVEDAARAIANAYDLYEGSEPVNIGTGKEIKIKDLAVKIANIIGYKGKFIFNTSKPDGQPRRCLNVNKAKTAFDFEAMTDFDTGLKNTVEWYIKHFNMIEEEIKHVE